MRAIQCLEVGPLSGLVVSEIDPIPLPAGMIRVAVAAAGVNYVDALFVEGKYQIKPRPPFTPGSEVAGTIQELSDGVSGFDLGDRVMVSCGLGGFAEEVIVHPSQATRVPDSLSLAAAATMTQSYCTALFALRERARLSAGEQVLVLGGGGGVGFASIQVARALGAHVVATASTDAKRAHARAGGATDIFDPDPTALKDVVRSATNGGVDVVVDPVGDVLADPALRCLIDHGRYLVIGFAGGEIPAFAANQILLRNRSVLGVDWGAWSLANASAQHRLLGDVIALVEAGAISPPEPTGYPLDAATEALTDLTSRRLTGKAALIVSDEADAT